MKRSLLLLSIGIVLLAGCQLEDLKEPCTAGTHPDENNVCVPDSDSPDACGFPVQNCLAQTGVAHADCNKGKCIIIDCQDGYFLEENSETEVSECKYDESRECESDGDCKLLPNAMTMVCKNNLCKITECTADYKLIANQCVPLDYCINNLDCDIPNAQSVCTDNHCSIVSCDDGYFQIDEKCIEMPPGFNLSCSSDEQCDLLPHALVETCKNNAYCTASECEEGYELKEYSPNDDIVFVFCARADQKICLSGDDCNPLPDGTSLMECDDLVCVATACEDNYRIEVQGDRCVEIVPHECTMDSDCMDDKTALTAVCEENQCKYTSCVQDYHIKNDVCIKDSLSECGSVENDCTALKGVVQGKVKCSSAECEATECESEYTLLGGKCIQSSILSCNGIDCTKLDGTLIDHLNCIEGKCVSDKCGSKNDKQYHLKDGACIEDSDNECGDSLVNCTEIVSHCINAQCVKTECAKNQHIENNECVADSSAACGVEPKDCTKIDSKATKVDCVEGACKIITCQAGTHLKNNQCLNDSAKECGNKLVNCMDVTGVTKVDCIEGACKVTECDTEYTLHKNGYCCYKKNLNLKKTKEVRKQACITGDVIINSTVTTAEFPYLIRIGGQLHTNGQSYLNTFKVPKLQTVNGGISIYNTSLTELEFPILKRIGNDSNFNINSNKLLKTLSVPKTITGNLYSVYIYDNDALESIKLNTTSEELSIEDNKNLTCKSICEGTSEINAEEAYISGNKDSACNVNGYSSGQLHDKCTKIK